MSNIVVIGTQWGDEGKGKIVDLLSEKSEIIVRFQGGHNAGHTLVIGSNEYKLSLLPSGIIRKNKISIIGNGVVVDLLHLCKEINELIVRDISITPKNLKLSENCFLILPIHKYIDELREGIKNSAEKIGTTGRGIGPAYEDKVGRRGLRIADLKNKVFFEKKMRALYQFYNIWIAGSGFKKRNYKKDLQLIFESYQKVQPYVCNTWLELNKYIKAEKKILFEGAQGTFLDVDHGTYPYVTSSNTISGNATIGSGVGPNLISYVLGITKAYTTRVGNGPFPTEEKGNLGEKLAKVGKEIGTVTGRKRRCGWFDAVLIKKAVIISGVSGLALTKLDVLDGFDEIKICYAYKLNGKQIDFLPLNEDEQKILIPVYKSLPGWQSNTFGIKKFEDLPNKAVTFVKEIEKLVMCSIDIISTGPDRLHTIVLNKFLS